MPPIRQVLKSHGQDYLVGNRLSKADVHLVELLYYVEEFDPSLLVGFPLLKVSRSLQREGPRGLSWNLVFGLLGPHHCPGLHRPQVSKISS